MMALIVCSAGSGVGLGHLTRSIVVAQSLFNELGMDSCILVQGEKIEHTDLALYQHEFISADDSLFDVVVEKLRNFLEINIVVLDLHQQHIPENIGELLSVLRQRDCKVISIDGLVQYHNKLDMIFIPSIYISPLNFDSITIPIIFGWDCFLLNIKQYPKQWQSGENVLILTGGGDATGLGRTLPKLLCESISKNASIHWVIGPYAEMPVWPDSTELSIYNHKSPIGLDSIMLQANYAITIFGVSFFELLYYGIPTVVFSPYGSKDSMELNIIEDAGVALVARNEIDAVSKMNRLMKDDHLAEKLSQSARLRMSYRGGHKFAKAVAELIS